MKTLLNVYFHVWFEIKLKVESCYYLKTGEKYTFPGSLLPRKEDVLKLNLLLDSS